MQACGEGFNEEGKHSLPHSHRILRRDFYIYSNYIRKQPPHSESNVIGEIVANEAHA